MLDFAPILVRSPGPISQTTDMGAHATADRPDLRDVAKLADHAIDDGDLTMDQQANAALCARFGFGECDATLRLQVA